MCVAGKRCYNQKVFNVFPKTLQKTFLEQNSVLTLCRFEIKIALNILKTNKIHQIKYLTVVLLDPVVISGLNNPNKFSWNSSSVGEMCGGVTTFSTTGTMGVVNIPFVCVTEETIRRLWDVTRGLQVINCFNCYGN